MSNKDLPHSERTALLVGGAVAFVLGILGGLWRANWNIPLPDTQPASFHGAITVGAFIALVGLEHAVAQGRRWAYASPGCAVLGALAAAGGAPHLLSAALLGAASVLLAVLAFGNWRADRAPHAAMGLAGALAGVAGYGLWLAGFSASEAAGAWTAFLVLTLVGERLELSHVQRPGNRGLVLLATAALLLGAGAAAWAWHWRYGTLAAGAGLVGLAAWLLAHDVALRDLRHRGRPRFTAACLLGAYVWLGIGGLALPFAETGSALFDAALHAILIGFVLCVVMAHAPAILSALLAMELPHAPWFYAHLALLDASLAIRVVASILSQPEGRAWGALGNALALALFAAATVVAVRRARSGD